MIEFAITNFQYCNCVAIVLAVILVLRLGFDYFIFCDWYSAHACSVAGSINFYLYVMVELIIFMTLVCTSVVYCE